MHILGKWPFWNPALSWFNASVLCDRLWWLCGIMAEAENSLTSNLVMPVLIFKLKQEATLPKNNPLCQTNCQSRDDHPHRSCRPLSHSCPALRGCWEPRLEGLCRPWPCTSGCGGSRLIKVQVHWGARCLGAGLFAVVRNMRPSHTCVTALRLKMQAVLFAEGLL